MHHFILSKHSKNLTQTHINIKEEKRSVSGRQWCQRKRRTKKSIRNKLSFPYCSHGDNRVKISPRLRQLTAADAQNCQFHSQTHAMLPSSRSYVKILHFTERNKMKMRAEENYSTASPYVRCHTCIYVCSSMCKWETTEIDIKCFKLLNKFKLLWTRFIDLR